MVVIGGGRGGKAVLSRMLRSNWVVIIGVIDQNPDAEGIRLAREVGLPCFIGDPIKILEGMKVDLVFELTGDPQVAANLNNLPNRPFDVASGQVTYLLWEVIRELEAQEDDIRQCLGEQEILSEISLMLSKSETSDQVFEAIVTGAMRMTQMPAGSLSIYNNQKQELFLVTAKGFSSSFYKNATYPIRLGGLSEHILSRHEPVLVSNIEEHPSFNNPILLREGIRSLIAVPLISESGPVGILYIDDFKVRTFSPSVPKNLIVLGTQAVIAIKKQQAFERIKSISVRDPLTGIYNRRYLNEIIHTEMNRTFRLHRPLSVLLIDIDHFKGINDRFGHLVGDHVLHDLARLFESVIRPYDTIARFGGDEFLILMTETDEEDALAAAERLREIAASSRLLPESAALTCSIGIGILKSNEKSLPTQEDLISRADKALYREKAAGRNRAGSFQSAPD
ncbi:MAG: sensor domain-containing diguanylate cyclase [Nitrospiria bacterium]